MRVRKALISFAGLALIASACGDSSSDNATGSDTTGATDTASDTGGTTDTGSADVSGDAPTSNQCNPITQDCADPAQNCTFGSTDDFSSCQPEGTIAYGDPCGGADLCKRGICLNLNQTENLCYQFCNTIAHCDDSTECIQLTDAPFKVCRIADIYQTCDLLQQNCDAGKACYSVSNEPQPICLPAGTADIDEPCADAAGCLGGQLCVNSRCKKICDRTAQDPCGTFGQCSQWQGDAGYCDQ